MASASGAPSGPARSPQRSTWVECVTPTTGRKYFIHRRTGKISWADPFAAEAAEGTGGAAARQPVAAEAGWRIPGGAVEPLHIPHSRQTGLGFRVKSAAAGAEGSHASETPGSNAIAAAAADSPAEKTG